MWVLTNTVTVPLPSRGCPHIPAASHTLSVLPVPGPGQVSRGHQVTVTGPEGQLAGPRPSGFLAGLWVPLAGEGRVARGSSPKQSSFSFSSLTVGAKVSTPRSLGGSPRADVIEPACFCRGWCHQPADLGHVSTAPSLGKSCEQGGSWSPCALPLTVDSAMSHRIAGLCCLWVTSGCQSIRAAVAAGEAGQLPHADMEALQ